MTRPLNKLTHVAVAMAESVAMELEVVVGTYDSRIIGYSLDLLQKPEEQVLRKKYHEKGHVGCVRCIASNGRYLATGGTDESIKLYDMRKHTDVGALLHHEGSISCLCFYKGGHLLSGSDDGTVCVWKCGGNWDHLHTLTGHKYAVTGVSAYPTGRLALSVGKDRTVRLWNLSTGLSAFTLRLPKAAELVIWSPIGDQYVLAVGTALMVYSVESGECTVMVEVGKKINFMLFIQDAVIAIASDKSAVELYSVTSGQLIASLEGHTARVKGLALSPDDQLLLSASSDGTIRAWRLHKSLVESTCVSCVDTGVRLTCMTALVLRLGKTLPAQDTGGTQSGKEKTGRTPAGEEVGGVDPGKGSSEDAKIEKRARSKERTLESVKTKKRRREKKI